MRKIKRVCFAVSLIMILSGCQGITELENRAFATSIGIDKGKDGFLVSVSFPDLSAYAEKGGKAPETVVSAEGGTIPGCFDDIGLYLSRKLYFGHTKIIIFGEKLLSDEKLFKEALDAIERNSEISNSILVLAAKDAKKILSIKTETEQPLGFFVSGHYKNKPEEGFVSFKKDFEGLLNDLKVFNAALIPEISREAEKKDDKSASDDEEKKEKIKISGGALIKDYTMLDFLSGEEVKGYSFIKGSKESAKISADVGGTKALVALEGLKTKLKFYDGEDGLTLYIDVYAKGVVESFYRGGSESARESEIEKAAAGEIEKEIEKTLNLMQKKYKADCLGFIGILRKFNPELYEKYGNKWDETFAAVNVLLHVDLDVLTSVPVEPRYSVFY